MGSAGIASKARGLLNINGFYDHLIAFVQNMVDVGLLNKQNQEMLLVADNIEELVAKMELYEAPSVPKWLDKERS
nr:LOG family protein [Sphingobacterium sp. T2]